MIINLIRPIIAKLKSQSSSSEKAQLLTGPAPTVEVTKQAEDEYYASMRQELKKKVWEKNGGVVCFFEFIIFPLVLENFPHSQKLIQFYLFTFFERY